jgi:uracil-DNA glycosylase family 4
VKSDTHSRFDVINQEIVSCHACPRLARYIREVAVIRRRAYRDQEYWGKPVPSFGDPDARLLIVGLAPGAHGANRTGRPFTGDRSGEYLYRALHRAGFANQAESRSADDGLELHDAWITAAVHCAPPDNKPSMEEITRCSSRFLDREFAAMPQVEVVVVLGKIAFDAWRSILRARGRDTRGWKFGHNVTYPGKPALVCSYHPSQQNTSTGRLTDAMLNDVFAGARKIIRSGPIGCGSDLPAPRR